MKTFSRVIVVGGGPCGSFTALNLARLGVDIAIFEEHNEIGIPCHCAGHVSINGLKRLGLFPLPEKVVENNFYGAVFHSPSGKEFSVRFSSPITCIVNRTLFDKYVAKMAKDSGAQYFLNSRVQSLIVEDGFVKGTVVRHNGNSEKCSAKIVVDAEGISSGILKQTGLVMSNRNMLVNAMKAEVENVENLQPDMVEVFLGREFAPDFYAWLIPKGDGRASIGLGAKTGNPKKLLEKFMLKHPVASSKLGSAKVLQTAFHPISLGGLIPKTYLDGFLAVGDAASQVKPTTGGGLILGLTCARVAAETTFEALQRNEFSSDFLSTYQRRCEKIAGFDFKFMLGFRKMLNAMSDDRLDDAIDFCKKFNLDKVFESFEDVDFQGHSLLRVLWSPRVPVALLYFLFLYFGANV